MSELLSDGGDVTLLVNWGWDCGFIEVGPAETVKDPLPTDECIGATFAAPFKALAELELFLAAAAAAAAFLTIAALFLAKL